MVDDVGSILDIPKISLFWIIIIIIFDMCVEIIPKWVSSEYI